MAGNQAVFPSARQWVGLGLTAALCGLLSWASLRWSPLPGRPLVDAAAGFALVAVLVCGRRAMLAIWVGVAVGRWLWASAMPACGHGNCHLVLTANVHALAEAVQAGLGAWLLQRRPAAWNQLDEPREIWGFFLRAAAVPCLVSMLLTTAYHGGFGGLPWSAAPAAAGSHWVGSVLGVMIGAPIALAWVGTPRPHWAPRRWPITLTGLTCAVLVHLGVAALAAADARRTRTEFNHGVQLAVTLARAELQGTLQPLRAMKMLFAGSAEVTDAEFRAATGGWLSTLDELQAIGWVDCPRVDGLVPAPPRVRLVEPASQQPPGDGSGWFAQPAARAAMAQALRTGRPTASAQVPLGRDGAGEAAVSGVVVFQAVPQMWRPGEGCGQSASGLVFAILPLPRLAQVFGQAVSPPLALCLLDRSHADGGQLLVGSPDCESVPSARRHAEPLLLADRRWELLVYDRSRTPVHGTEVVAGVSTAGMLGAAALVVLLLTVTGRARRIEAAVAEAEVARRAAEAANLAKTSFLSRMSHELRTPLNAVLGFAQLLEAARAPALAEPHLKWASNIRQAGDHLLAMINDILDLSRIETDTLNLSIQSLSVQALVSETVTLVEQRAAQRGVVIRAELPAEAGHLLGDATRVRQVLVNLLSNAVKYNREGGDIHVLSRRTGRMVEIEVRDTGLGLDAAQLAQLFEPFNRLGRERGLVEGTGIGLVISRRLALLMGGELRVASEPGLGSSFTLALPADDGARRVAEAPPAAAEPAVTGLPPQRIHYVEDNPLNFEIMRAALAQFHGLVLEHSTTGQQCLDQLTDEGRPRPDLLLLDLHLPDIEGLALLKRLKADPATAGLPVVVVSADAMDASIDAAMAAGALEFLTKPIDVARLRRVLARHGGITPAS